MILEKRQPQQEDSGEKGLFHLPFSLRIEPMARLLLINLQQNPIYKGIEPQWFDDAQRGHGLLVILYRADGKVDVYHQSTVIPDREGYHIEGGLGDLVACDFTRSRFDIGPHGVDADIAFMDLAGRQIEVLIREEAGCRAGQFALLAPLGHTIQRPQEMPLFFMYDFSFVKKRNTVVKITIDDAPQKLVNMPVPMGGSRVYFSRYCGDPLIAFWNRANEGPMAALPVAEAGTLRAHGVDWGFVADENGRLALATMSAGRPGNEGQPDRHLRITFTPPLPEVTALSHGANFSGKFVIDAAPEAGEVRGTWQAQRHDDQVTLRLHPGGGWQPGEKSLMPRLIFFLARPFKQWPKTYEWTAVIDLSQPAPLMRSTWRRL